MLKHMLTTQGGGPQAAAAANGTRMAATATVVGIPSVEVRKSDDVMDSTEVAVLQKPLDKTCMCTATTPTIHLSGKDDTVGTRHSFDTNLW